MSGRPAAIDPAHRRPHGIGGYLPLGFYSPVRSDSASALAESAVKPLGSLAITHCRRTPARAGVFMGASQTTGCA
jgi:hypothetical protein